MSRLSLFATWSLIALAVLVPDIARAQNAGWRPPLKVVSWGGAYTRAQMLAVVRPYREMTDEWVTVDQYDGGLGRIRAQVRSLNVTWDVVDLELPDAIRGCDEGVLERIDPGILAPSPSGQPATADFFDRMLRPCAVGQVVFATVVAYRPDSFPDAPSAIGDLFDLDSLPGRRGLRRTPKVNLEWALIADGVPRDRVYDLLDTPEGVARAFDVLDRIKPEIVWWQDGEAPADLLARGLVSMSSAWNGRIYSAQQLRSADLDILWDANAWDADLWAIPKGSENLERAIDFIRFATAPERLAAISNQTAYGPARRSAIWWTKRCVRTCRPAKRTRRCRSRSTTSGGSATAPGSRPSSKRGSPAVMRPSTTSIPRIGTELPVVAR